MGRLRNITESIHEFTTEYVEDEYDSADGDGGYDISTKIAMLLLKEEINKPLRRLEDYFNEMPRIPDRTPPQVAQFYNYRSRIGKSYKKFREACALTTTPSTIIRLFYVGFRRILASVRRLQLNLCLRLTAIFPQIYYNSITYAQVVAVSGDRARLSESERQFAFAHTVADVLTPAPLFHTKLTPNQSAIPTGHFRVTTEALQPSESVK